MNAKIWGFFRNRPNMSVADTHVDACRICQIMEPPLKECNGHASESELLSLFDSRIKKHNDSLNSRERLEHEKAILEILRQFKWILYHQEARKKSTTLVPNTRLRRIKFAYRVGLTMVAAAILAAVVFLGAAHIATFFAGAFIVACIPFGITFLLGSVIQFVNGRIDVVRGKEAAESLEQQELQTIRKVIKKTKQINKIIMDQEHNPEAYALRQKINEHVVGFNTVFSAYKESRLKKSIRFACVSLGFLSTLGVAFGTGLAIVTGLGLAVGAAITPVGWAVIGISMLVSGLIFLETGASKLRSLFSRDHELAKTIKAKYRNFTEEFKEQLNPPPTARRAANPSKAKSGHVQSESRPSRLSSVFKRRSWNGTPTADSPANKPTSTKKST